MNELDSHLEKTSEIFEIGSIEKKLQLLKVGNILEISENFLASDRVRYLTNGSGPKRVHPRNLRKIKILRLCVFFAYSSFHSRHFIFDTRVLYDISTTPKSGF